eukprot:855556-Rhodomonas_salina.1
MPSLCDAVYCHGLCRYAFAMRCPVLTAAILLSGHAGGCVYRRRHPSGAIDLCWCYVMPGTATTSGSIALRTSYAMPGTGVACGSTCLRDAQY